MGGGSTLWLVAAVCVALFGGALRQAFQAMEAKKFQSMWGWYSLTCLASGALVLTWAANGDASVISRNVLVGIFGAAFGASVFIWAGYLLQGRKAEAQQPQTSASPPVSQPSPEPPQSGNFSIGQQGGTVKQTYINQAPGRMQFTDAIGSELLTALPKDKAIKLIVTGTQSDLEIGRRFESFLVAHGYTVDVIRVGMIVPPPDRPLTWNPATSELTVAPSAR